MLVHEGLQRSRGVGSIDQLEEESSDDQDYYINGPTLEAFEAKGIDPALLALLKGALGDRDDMEIVWSRS